MTHFVTPTPKSLPQEKIRLLQKLACGVHWEPIYLLLTYFFVIIRSWGTRKYQRSLVLGVARTVWGSILVWYQVFFHFDQWSMTFDLLMTSLIKLLLFTLYGVIEDT